MKNFIIAIRSLFKQGRSNGIKILSLGVGLAMGLVLISKVCFNQSFDTFYPDADRIYRLQETIYKETDGGLKVYGQVPGAVAPGMKAEIPEIEVATRLTYIGGGNTLFFTPDKQRYSARFVLMADSNVFDIFPIPILIGDPKDVLARPGYVMVSRKIADNLGGVANVVGKTFELESRPGTTYTIGGVFENTRENSHLRFDILVSLQGMNEWSRTNWLGNDRYLGYIKLYPGVTGESLHPAMRKVMEQHVDMESVKKSGVDLSFTTKPMLEMHSGSDEVKSMNSLLLLLAIVLLFASMMNYVLIVLSTLLNRTKEVAVHKCYGASEKNLFGMILSETLLHVVLSLLLAVVFILICRGKVEELLDVTLGGLFTPETMLVLLGICVAIFFITGLIPTYMFLRVPVAAAFRNYKESRRYWKLFLLFVQFAATAYLVSLLGTINRQYDLMVHDNPGYEYENVVYYNAMGIDRSVRELALEQLGKLPIVDKVSSAYSLPFWGASGNNVALPGDDKELFNIADLYWVNDDYFELMEIPVIEGNAFRRGESNANKVMVSRAFADKITKLVGWKDGVVGKNIWVSEHCQHANESFVISGVYENIRVGSLADLDNRPSAIFYGKDDSYTLLIKLHELTAENIRQVTNVLQEVMPDRQVEVSAYRSEMLNLYRESRNFRDSILIGGIVTLIIALVGLMGYTTDETNRRGREIAIRKVNGATAWDILKMISKDISFIAIPALVIGIAVAYYSSEGWLRQFAEKVPLSWLIFLAGAAAIYFIIIGCVLFRAWEVANDNPVDSIKSE